MLWRSDMHGLFLPAESRVLLILQQALLSHKAALETNGTAE
jgi:hypothetical protein